MGERNEAERLRREAHAALDRLIDAHAAGIADIVSDATLRQHMDDMEQRSKGVLKAAYTAGREDGRRACDMIANAVGGMLDDEDDEMPSVYECASLCGCGPDTKYHVGPCVRRASGDL